jgi:putative FmdB family regulatory protein
MPLYEYRCEACGRIFEVLQRVGAGAEGLVCPECGKARLSREASGFATSGTSRGCAPRGRFT